MEFDNKGNLSPDQLLEITLITFEERFVASFPESSTRRKLYKNFCRYTESIKKEIGTDFFQWIDRSFVTNKLNPKDIDLVTFIDWRAYYANENFINSLRDLRQEKDLGIDGYFLIVYPEDHKKNILFETDKIQWMFEFGRSRTDYKKGFIQINY